MTDFVMFEDNGCDWWLRTPGEEASDALFIYENGHISEEGVNVDWDDFGVRPAMIIKP